MDATMDRIVRHPSSKGPRWSPGPRPKPSKRRTLFRTVAVGIDGTDEGIATATNVALPKNSNELVLGHEALAEVVAPQPGGRLRQGDLVVPLVREGCGLCAACRSGAVDLCRSDDYREHGIRGLDGFMQEFWLDREDHVVSVPKTVGKWGVLVEPLSIIVKAFDEARSVQSRLPWVRATGFEPKRALIVGSGSLASMAALLLRHKKIPTSVLDRHLSSAASAKLWRALGVKHLRRARMPKDPDEGYDLILETTGVPKVAMGVADEIAPNGIMVLLGIPRDRRGRTWLSNQTLSRMVLRNQAILGSVNSSRFHFEVAIRALSEIRRAQARLYGQIVTHTFTRDQSERAFSKGGDDVVKKVVHWDGDDQ